MALLQLGELLERQRVDRTEQAQLAVELADPRRGRHAVGQLRRRSRLGGLGLDVEVVAQHLDGRLQPQPGLGLVDLGTGGPAREPRRARARPRCARPRRSSRRVATAAIAALCARRRASSRSRYASDRGPPLPHELGQPVEGPQRAFDLRAPVLGRRPRGGVGGEAALGLGEPSGEQLPALVAPGRPHLEVAAAPDEHGGAPARSWRGPRCGPGPPPPRRRRRPPGRARARRARRCAPARRPPARPARRCAAAAARPRRGSRAARPASGPAPRSRR